MEPSQKYIVIVDAYSAGNLLAPEFQTRGIRCLHVQSTPKIWDILLPTFRPEHFEKNFALDSNLDSIVAELRAFSIAGIVPGTETGVELADQLSERLGLPGNGLARSEARRNKFLMVEAAREYGLRVAKQERCSSVEQVLEFAKTHRFDRVVVKPLKSAGTDSVAICGSTDSVRSAVKAILGKTNKLGIPNTEVLVQEFLSGTEYFLNTVSLAGRHHFTEIWRYRKRSINGRNFVYDCNELLPFAGTIESQLRKYVEGVLEALQISYGPAHTEVIMTQQGPVLVESGARLDGLSVPTVNVACIGYSAVDLTVDSYIDPIRYKEKASTPYDLQKHALTVYLTSYEEGEVLAIPGKERLEQLSSFFQMRLRVKEGSTIKKTIDYFTAPGFLTLVHPDKETLMADYEQIRKLENENKLFSVRS